MLNLEETSSTPCPSCGGIVLSGSRFCNHCGRDINPSWAEDQQSPPRRNKTLILASVGILALLLLVLAIILFWTNDNSSNAVNGTNSAAAKVSLSPRAQALEAKILKGERMSEADISGLETAELRILRNTHFAKYGRRFEKPGLGDYFPTTSWYQINGNYSDNMLSTIDKANVALIAKYEQSVNILDSNTAAALNSNAGSNSNSAYTNAASTPQLQLNDARQVTVQNAEDALKRFLLANGFREITNLRVTGGILEKPGSNSASAQWAVDTFFWEPANGTYKRGVGEAVFSHYNDGRWALTSVYFMGFGSGAHTVTRTYTGMSVTVRE